MHPHVMDQIPKDLKILGKFVDIGRWIFPKFQYKWVVDEMKFQLPQELDFQLEAENMLKIH